MTLKISLTPKWSRCFGFVALSWSAIAAVSLPQESSAQTVAASYEFNGTFAADQPGVPALVAVDPGGMSGFGTTTVYGQSRPVWSFNGTNSPATSQAGFTLNTTNLVAPQGYSLELVCQFTQRDSAYRRILDVQNRQSDNGFYVDPSNNLDIFPVSGSTAAWTNNAFHTVVLTDNGTQVSVYLDGVAQFTATTTIMNLDADLTDNPNHLMGFFLDNVAAGGQGEWSPGSVAFAQLWNGVLTPAQASAVAANPFAVPEPSGLAMAVAGCLGLFFAGNRWRRMARAI